MDHGPKSGPVPHRCPHRCGTRTLGLTPSVRPWNRYVKSCFIINCQLLYNQLPTSDTILKWTLVPQVGRFHMVPLTMWNPDTGPDSKYLAMKPMCQIMFLNQLANSDTIHKWALVPEVGRFHINEFTDVEPGHWGGHRVSGHGTNVSNHVS